MFPRPVDTGGDFIAKNDTRIIPAGETRKTIWVEFVADDRVEGQEQFRLQVDVRSNNAVVADGIAVGTIVDR